MNKIIVILFVLISFLFAQEEQVHDLEKINSADCLILEDENSIICKYLHDRVEEDKEIKVQWIDPQGNISRERTLIFPAGHGSIYDFRYIEGRMTGIWQFKVFEDDNEITTTFTIK